MNETLDLPQRLERLERENRRWKLAGSLGGVGLAVVMLTAQAQPGHVVKVLEAERFVLRDAHGKTLAVLGAQADSSLASSPALTLYDSVGRVRAMLSVGLDSPRLSARRSPTGQEAMAREEAARAQFASMLGTPTLTFYDRQGTARAMMGDKGLGLADDTGTLRATLGDEVGSPALTFYDGKEIERAKLTPGSLQLIDSEDKALASMSASLLGLFAEDGKFAGLTKQDEGSLWLDFRDQTAKRRVSLGVRPDGAPGLVVDDKDVRLTGP